MLTNDAVLEGVSLSIQQPNVIVRNLSVRKVLADNGDAIHIQGTEVKNVWIDHCDLSSDMDHDKVCSAIADLVTQLITLADVS